MDGRSVWPDAFEPRATALAAIDDGKPIRLVPTTSFLLLPVTVEGEDLPAGLPVRPREGARPGAVAGGAGGRRGAIGPGAAAGASGRRSAS